jgi:hypothetical protein
MNFQNHPPASWIRRARLPSTYDKVSYQYWFSVPETSP